MGAAEQKSVLIVDDDAVTMRTFGREFARRGWRVFNADSCATATTTARRHRPGLIVLDLQLRDGTALDVIGPLRSDVPAARVVVTTGFATVGTAVEAMRLGAQHYVEKPCSVETLIAAAAEPARALPPLLPSFASLAQSERTYIEQVIAACSGNISEAARRLGVHRRSLQRKLRKNVPELPGR